MVIIDGDEETADGCQILPGDDAPERVVFAELKVQNWPGVADARRTIEFLTCLYKSAFTGQPVKRGSIGPDDPFYSSMNGKTGTTV